MNIYKNLPLKINIFLIINLFELLVESFIIFHGILNYQLKLLLIILLDLKNYNLISTSVTWDVVFTLALIAFISIGQKYFKC